MSSPSDVKSVLAPQAFADDHGTPSHIQGTKTSVERLEELRRRVHEGTYHVQADLLADAVLRSWEVAK